MNILISGGCKNGKSYFAQHLAKVQAKGEIPLYYLATMRPCDDEDRIRIRRHQMERKGWGFQTLEKSENICDCLEEGGVDAEGVFLLDSVTALLSNEMFLPDGTVNSEAGEKTAADLTALCKRTGNLVMVSDYIYSDAVRYDELSEAYRRNLARADRAAAAASDVVLEIAFGRMQIHKGQELFGEWAAELERCEIIAEPAEYFGIREIE